MFDVALAGPESLESADDASVVAAIFGWARVEAAAAARRLAAVAELVRRRADGPVDCARWSCDNWDQIAAEVAAAQGISHGMASGQMYLAVALRDRLPRVGALFTEGDISARLASAIVWHTDLVKDPRTLHIVDAALACDARRFGPLSVAKAAQAIDAIVGSHDPAAVRRAQAGARGRDVVITPADDQSGTANLWGSLFASDAAVLDRRLAQMAHGVCRDDPRTVAQRRADALGALAAGADTLGCACGKPDCPSGLTPDPRATSVTIHVVADAAALDPRPESPSSTAHIIGGATVPAPQLAELIRDGAKVRRLPQPGDAASEPGYRPSAALERFIRCRDMTCRFPGCDRSAEFCDIDHTVPYPFGLTHPSNLKCLCRKHHLLKTFWTSWRDEQRPDGTVVWTSPSGHTYTTRPGSRLLFPTLSLPTGELPMAPGTVAQDGDRGVMMPRRRRTREQDRMHRIDAERALNTRLRERRRPPPAPPPTIASDADPPPF
jgi:Domain of unknown function (DUF222)